MCILCSHIYSYMWHLWLRVYLDFWKKGHDLQFEIRFKITVDVGSNWEMHSHSVACMPMPSWLLHNYYCMKGFIKKLSSDNHKLQHYNLLPLCHYCTYIYIICSYKVACTCMDDIFLSVMHSSLQYNACHKKVAHLPISWIS